MTRKRNTSSDVIVMPVIAIRLRASETIGGAVPASNGTTVDRSARKALDDLREEKATTTAGVDGAASVRVGEATSMRSPIDATAIVISGTATVVAARVVRKAARDTRDLAIAMVKGLRIAAIPDGIAATHDAATGGAGKKDGSPIADTTAGAAVGDITVGFIIVTAAGRITHVDITVAAIRVGRGMAGDIKDGRTVALVVGTMDILPITDTSGAAGGLTTVAVIKTGHTVAEAHAAGRMPAGGAANSGCMGVSAVASRIAARVRWVVSQ